MVYVRMMTENTDKVQEPVLFPEVYDRRRLNALYREIPLKDNTSRLLRKYFKRICGKSSSRWIFRMKMYAKRFWRNSMRLQRSSMR